MYTNTIILIENYATLLWIYMLLTHADTQNKLLLVCKVNIDVNSDVYIDVNIDVNIDICSQKFLKCNYYYYY